MASFMMDVPLLVSGIIEHAAAAYPDGEVVARENDDGIERSTYAEVALRARRFASALAELGIVPGERVAALAWSTRRYFELFYGVSGTGAVLHTVNPRLFEDDLAYVVDHAGAAAVCVDRHTLALAEALAERLPKVRHWIWLDAAAALPGSTTLGPLTCYDDMVAAGRAAADWPSFDESSACTICYTSGTTGRPKGVVYTHRANVLLTLTSLSRGFFGFPSHAGDRQSFLSLTGLFHANGWTMPYAAPFSGASLVLAGRDFTAPRLFELIDAGAVTFAAGVPTIAQAMVDHARAARGSFGSLRFVALAGSRPPRSLVDALETEFGVEVGQAWGMTEAQMGAMPVLKPGYDRLDAAARVDLKARGGLLGWGVEARVVDDAGAALPADGGQPGNLQVRGPWVVDHYLGQTPHEALTQDGWFDTGDVAIAHRDGYLEIVDRSKDVIKSGGEWIGSAQIEAIAAGVDGVQAAAVIGIPDARWGERPLLVVVPRPDAELSADAVRAALRGRMASWWIPERVEFVDALPYTATGKIQKQALRERFVG